MEPGRPNPALPRLSVSSWGRDQASAPVLALALVHGEQVHGAIGSGPQQGGKAVINLDLRQIGDGIALVVVCQPQVQPPVAQDGVLS